MLSETNLASGKQFSGFGNRAVTALFHQPYGFDWYQRLAARTPFRDRFGHRSLVNSTVWQETLTQLNKKGRKPRSVAVSRSTLVRTRTQVAGLRDQC